MRGLDQRTKVKFFKRPVIEDNFYFLVAKDVVSESITTSFGSIL
jgi:hypothetical protein